MSTQPKVLILVLTALYYAPNIVNLVLSGGMVMTHQTLCS